MMANAIRVLAMDAENESFCHPGMPMGNGGVATVLLSKFLNLMRSPAPVDRFSPSAGHGSMLVWLYI
jgi:transketolase